MSEGDYRCAGLDVTAGKPHRNCRLRRPDPRPQQCEISRLVYLQDFDWDPLTAGKTCGGVRREMAGYVGHCDHQTLGSDEEAGGEERTAGF